MKTKIYLVADRKGIQRMTKQPPSLLRSEVAVGLTITIPDNAFRAPTIAVNVDVPEEHVMQPVIVAEVDIPPALEGSQDDGEPREGEAEPPQNPVQP